MPDTRKDIHRDAPDSPLHELAYDLGEHRATFRAMALRRKRDWEPSQQECFEIARRLIDGLKRRGVVQIVREVSRAQGGTSGAPVSVVLPLWRARPARNE
jgi:hypothetical protein